MRALPEVKQDTLGLLVKRTFALSDERSRLKLVI